VTAMILIILINFFPIMHGCAVTESLAETQFIASVTSLDMATKLPVEIR